jgi:RNA polymerase sigma-70 factor (ECF subfamily)
MLEALQRRAARSRMPLGEDQGMVETRPDPLALEHDLTTAFVEERPRLVRFCAHLTGDRDVAEDLAQETFAEAWRARMKLRDSSGLSAWLTIIARHVCLRWLRAHARDLRYRERIELDDELEGGAVEQIATEHDLSEALERSELSYLLNRALALLPHETRALLLDTYVRERSPVDLAAEHGVVSGTLRARLHRGRQALRQALTTHLRHDALAAEILPAETASWQKTRIWCPFCGRHPLETNIDRTSGAYSYRCAGNCTPGSGLVGVAYDALLLDEISSPKTILTRHNLASYTGYRQTLAAARAGEATVCPRCGGEAAMRQTLPGTPDNARPTPLFLFGVYLDCPRCGPMSYASPWHLTLHTPSAVRFWQRHPRIRALSIREVTVNGRAALVTGFESALDAARIEIVSARDTYEVLRVFGEPEERAAC